MPRDHSREQPQWLLARHSALTARQLLRAYGLLCLFSLVIAAAFALRGLWYIPVFRSPSWAWWPLHCCIICAMRATMNTSPCATAS